MTAAVPETFRLKVSTVPVLHGPGNPTDLKQMSLATVSTVTTDMDPTPESEPVPWVAEDYDRAARGLFKIASWIGLPLLVLAILAAVAGWRWWACVVLFLLAFANPAILAREAFKRRAEAARLRAL